VLGAALEPTISILLSSSGPKQSPRGVSGFILHRKVLMDIDSGGDLGLLAHEIGFFDRTFPFAVFSTVSSTSEVRNEAREFFQTTLLACRKLKAINSNQTEQISGDEELSPRRLASQFQPASTR
jgi:hypothetical protein